MNHNKMRIVFCAIAATAICCGRTALAKEFAVENEYLKREISTSSGFLQTTKLTNKLTGKTSTPMDCQEFALRLSEGVNSQQPDIVLSSKDFMVKDVSGTAQEIKAELYNHDYGITVVARYTLNKTDFFGRKLIDVTCEKPLVLELMDIESIGLADAYNPYKAKDMMWTTTKFLPALGQPLYTSETGFFWGVEFPASWNRLEGKTIRCGYQRGLELKPGQRYTTYAAVYGVADDPEFVKDAFLEYIDRIRFHPYELHVQYNSWFDFGASVKEQDVVESLQTLHQELVVDRGCRPLDVYVIDDGWQNSRPPRSPLDDWSTGVYKVNTKTFSRDLKDIRAAIEAKNSKMGLWASPNCLFGAEKNCAVLQEKGYETLVGSAVRRGQKEVARAMSIAGPRYMDLFETRMLELADLGSVYFKFDGFFGHMGNRFFETVPGRGAPVMSDILPDNMEANDARFNDPKYDETKRYYITAASERLMTLFGKMHQRNPEVRILMHNGATISPWWLMHADVLSLVNQRDGAEGKNRTEQMVYRDGLYYQLFQVDANQSPLNSFFNHEPAKNGDPNDRFGDPSEQEFRKYFFMALSRGTGLVELYITVRSLDETQFDVMAEGLKWLYHISPAFRRSRMHGGNPVGRIIAAEQNLAMERAGINVSTDSEVYGYTGWTDTQGYVSIHNPTASDKSYSFTLDRKFGLVPGSGPFRLSFPMKNSGKPIKEKWAFGETVNVKLTSGEVLILNFDKN